VRRSALLIVPLLLVGLAGTAAVLASHESDAAFVFQQRKLTPVTASVLAQFVAAAPDPRPRLGHAKGVHATCTTKGLGELRNPWSCAVRYPRGGSVTYSVTISPRGYVNGWDSVGQLHVFGCCVGPHPTE
jgi:hypothetical protein